MAMYWQTLHVCIPKQTLPESTSEEPQTVEHLFSCPAFLRHRMLTAILLGLTHLKSTYMARFPDLTSAWNFLVNWFNSAISKQIARKTASKSFRMLKQAFKEDALLQTRTFEWFSRFKAGRTSVKDDLHTGRPLSIRNPENTFKIKSSIKENSRITIRELSEDLEISFETCQTIIKNDLHLKRSLAKFFPHLLTNEQKEHRKETCKNMV
ncbi:hypothetical protein LAZ67_6002718 [Cordylochernes scorpioides]|uniref:Mos1 transposase HTH domain-containing protein n=1 Tax=Cordylochernes scorpioides TaxID=51811 RepID=A0ABY6KK05_9ARAC|nr:hypothetical protein LAZ67_6002718 [Cordylochernes scorpioides]